MATESDNGTGGLTIGLAAALGGLGAVIVDLVQKGDASAIFKLTGTLNRYGHVLGAAWPDVPVLGVGIALIVFAIVLAYLSDARSRGAAFYSGASVITVLMTLVPYEAPLPPSSGTTVNKTSWSEDRPLAGAQLIQAAYRPQVATRLHYAAGGSLPVTVIVHLPLQEGQQAATPPRVDGRLFDSVTGKEWQIGFADPNPTAQASAKEVTYRFDFSIETGTPHGSTLADLRLRVTAQGYSMGQASLSVATPGLPVTMEVTLKPSGVPKGFQGLGRILDRPTF
jgi:hypothetical protein